jgi:hypothetical protein
VEDMQDVLLPVVPTQWRSVRTTNAIERLHEEFTAAMLFWALLASGQISMRKVDGGPTLATKPIDQPIDLAASLSCIKARCINTVQKWGIFRQG